MIPGGNDSFGTGISAGGAQVMGQSAGLNNLVKVAMQRPRNPQRLPNTVIPNISQSALIRPYDAKEISDNIVDMKNHGLASNLSQDPNVKFTEGNSMNDSYGKATYLTDLSKEAQKFSQEAFHSIHTDPYASQQSIDDFDGHYHNYMNLKLGTPEADAERLAMNPRRYTQYKEADTQNMLKNMTQNQITSNPSTFLGFKDVKSVETKKAYFDTLMNSMRNVGANNVNAQQTFEGSGKQLINDKSQKAYLDSMASEHGIDTTNAKDVGYANEINLYLKNAGLANIERNHIIKPTRPTIFNIGGQQAEQDSQGLNGIITPGGVGNINASQKSIADNGGELPTVKTKYKMNYDRIFGNGGKKITVAGGPVFTVADGKTVDAHPGTEFKMVGTSYKYKFDPGTEVNGHKMDGGYANAKTEQYIEDHPNSAMTKNFTKVNVTHGYMTFPGEDGNGPQEKEVFYPSANLPRNALFGKTSGKSIEANSNANNNTYLKNLTIKNNQANPTNEANIKESFNGKTLPGYKKSK